MNILEAMDDPALFAPHFRGGTWQPWRAFLAALFGLPMDDDALALYRHHTGRTEPPEGPAKEAALKVGRRGGKSRLMALTAVYLATCRDYTEFLAPGEVGTVAVVAADKRQARTVLRYVTGMLKAVPMLAELIEGETAESVTLSNSVVIEVTTASFRVTRGYTFVAVLADEIAFWRSEDTANPDREIIGAIRPGLATIPSSVLLMASSPYRRRGVLYDAFSRHYGQDAARVLCWSGTSLEMNPGLDPAIVEQAYEDDPEAAAAEYGAEWRADLSDYISREVVAALTPEVGEIAPIPGVRYVSFVDQAGGSGSDSFTLAIAHREGEKSILDAIREVRPPFSPEGVTSDYAALLKTYRVNRVVGDRYAGDWPRERFRAHGIEFALSEDSKSEIYLNSVPMLNAGNVQLLKNGRLLAQLCGLERRTSRGGRDSIDHAPNAHDDLANAAMGALLLASKAASMKPARFIRLNHMAR